VASEPGKSNWKSAAVRFALALAVLQLVFCSIIPQAPIWKWSDSDKKPTDEDRLLAHDGQFISAANGGNLAMRLRGFDTRDLDQSLLMCMTYYRANYLLYPRQVFVSGGGQAINTEAQLSEAVLPDEHWLAQQGARGAVDVQYQNGDVQIDARSISQD
jgi:hypothetical protein